MINGMLEKNINNINCYSNDGGNTWEKKDIFGDFFRAIHFPSSNVGYAVGQSGSIIKTIDAGKHWKFIRNGDAISTSNKSFRSVFFRLNSSSALLYVSSFL